MSSSKRNMQDFNNKESFPYTIYKGSIMFGPIYNKQTNNKIRLWKIIIDLFDLNDEKIKITENKIYNIEKDNYYTVIKKITYYTNEGSAIQESIFNKVFKGKNLGKKNETNIIQQSLIEARSEYLKKIKSGFAINIEENKIPYPMALNSYEQHIKKVTYPCYIQPKLDGIRCIIYKDNNKLKMVSRRMNEIYNFEFILEELEKTKSITNSMYLDGELYNHDLILQEISGIVRREDKKDKDKLYFYMFDYYDTSNPDINFEDRFKFISKNFNNLKHTKIVETEICNSEKEGDEKLNYYLEREYEGIIYKPTNRPYEFNINREKRSNYYLKRKPYFDSEFEIVGYELDKNDLIIFRLVTPSGFEFKSTPKWDSKKRKTFLDNNIDDDFIGKFATVRYDDLSEDKIPIRSRLICIRDYE